MSNIIRVVAHRINARVALEREPVTLESLVKNVLVFQKALGRNIKIGTLRCTSKYIFLEKCKVSDYYRDLDFQIGLDDLEDAGEYMSVKRELANEKNLNWFVHVDYSDSPPDSRGSVLYDSDDNPKRDLAKVLSISIHKAINKYKRDH